MTATYDQTMTTAAATEPRRSPHLPPVHPAAWHGPLGEAVVRIAPTTEADPIAVLVQALALFGAMCGAGPHVVQGSARHPARIWPLVIGKTSAGRKGTAWAEARRIGRLLGPYAERYLHERVMGGLSSGEGLLAALGASTPHLGDAPDDDPKAPDGKLFVIETEFARVLASAKRDGNTLGPVLRQMWDDGEAQIMTRGAPLKVSGAHLGLAAHITPRELSIKLADADIAGGTVNRFLLVASARTQLLAHEPPHPTLDDLTAWLMRALETARGNWGSIVRRDRGAEELWSQVYEALNHDDPDGPLGSVLARGPAYTMRLALAFALADGSSSISQLHLLAGLAVWHYSTLSARLVFDDARSRTDERRLAEFIAAGEDGRTRSEVYRFFGGNRRAEEITDLLDLLERNRQVRGEREETTGGRPAYRYRWTGRAIDPVLDILRSYSPATH